MDEAGTGELRSLAHPLRLRLLSLLTGTAMSAAEAARELGETQANVSYHLRKLREAGLLEIAEEVSIRGGRARRYRHDPESGMRQRRHTPQEQVATAVALGQELRRRSGSRTWGPGRASLTDAELWVTPAEWEEIVAGAAALSKRLHEIAQPPHTPGTIHTSTTMSLFEMDEP